MSSLEFDWHEDQSATRWLTYSCIRAFLGEAGAACNPNTGNYGRKTRLSGGLRSRTEGIPRIYCGHNCRNTFSFEYQTTRRHVRHALGNVQYGIASFANLICEHSF